MTGRDDAAAVAAGLSDRDISILLSSWPADIGEYWAPEATDDPRLCGNDCVLTPLGEQVRTHLQENPDA